MYGWDKVRMNRVTTVLMGMAACGVALLAVACSERRSVVGLARVAAVARAAELGALPLPSLAPSLSRIDGEPAMGAMFSTGAAFGGFTLAPLAQVQAQLKPILDAPPAVAAEAPKVPGLPGSEAACPTGMVLVDGESCTQVEHTCLKEMKDDPAHRCLEFKPGADVCVAPKGQLKFCMDRYEWPGTPGAQPRVLVDYFEAEKLCKSAGKRMCKEDEFYLACEGPEHWPYAWGHVRHPSPCNIDRPYYMVDWQKWAKGGENIVEEARRLDQALPIGSSQCWSPYGVHDIAGNVDEWTTARPGRELQGSLMGGYWGPVQNACRYVTTVHGPEFMFYQIGFRCCAEAKS